MLTFSITLGTAPRLLIAKSCSTIAPDRTSPKSKRASGKTVVDPLGMSFLTDSGSFASACDVTCDERQETRNVHRASNAILRAMPEITKVSKQAFTGADVAPSTPVNFAAVKAGFYSFR